MSPTSNCGGLALRCLASTWARRAFFMGGTPGRMGPWGMPVVRGSGRWDYCPNSIDRPLGAAAGIVRIQKVGPSLGRSLPGLFFPPFLNFRVIAGEEDVGH